MSTPSQRGSKWTRKEFALLLLFLIWSAAVFVLLAVVAALVGGVAVMLNLYGITHISRDACMLYALLAYFIAAIFVVRLDSRRKWLSRSAAVKSKV